MSKVIFERNMKKIRDLRELKDSNKIFVMDSRMPRILNRPVFLAESGLLTCDLTEAKLFDTHEAADATLSENQKSVFVDGGTIEEMVKVVMTENQKHMDHIKHHETAEEA